MTAWLVLTMLGVGLQFGPKALTNAWAHKRLIAAVWLFNLLLLPFIAWASYAVFDLPDHQAFGVFLCAVLAGSPASMHFATTSRQAVGVILPVTLGQLLLAVITAPLLLRWGSHFFDLDAVQVGAKDVLGTMGPAVVAPLMVGGTLRAALPNYAEKIRITVNRLGDLTTIGVVLATVLHPSQPVQLMPAASYLGALPLSLACCVMFTQAKKLRYGLFEASLVRNTALCMTLAHGLSPDVFNAATQYAVLAMIGGTVFSWIFRA